MDLFLTSERNDNNVDRKLLSWSKLLAWLIYFLSFVFFISWVIALQKEYIVIENSTIYSRIFFFINPRLLMNLLFSGNSISFIESSVNLSSLVFILFYFIAIFSFAFMYVLSCALFIISYFTKIRNFQYIACFGVIPVLGLLFNTYLIIGLVVHLKAVAKSKKSFFDAGFTAASMEDEEDEILEMNEDSPNFQYSYKHYKRMYIKKKSDDDVLRWLYDWVVKKLN